MKSLDKMSYNELHNLRGRVQSLMDVMDAEQLREIEVTPEEYHTLETNGRIPAIKQLRERTKCRLRVAMLAINKVEGAEISFV